MNARRKFLKTTTALLAGGAMTNLACVVSMAPLVNAEVDGNIVRFDTAVPELAKQGDGVALSSERLEYPILLIKRKDGTFSALSTECTHLGCTVKKQRIVLRCPCHGSVYDFEGHVMNGPAEQPLKQYEVALSGTVAEIRL